VFYLYLCNMVGAHVTYISHPLIFLTYHFYHLLQCLFVLYISQWLRWY